MCQLSVYGQEGTSNEKLFKLEVCCRDGRLAEKLLLSQVKAMGNISPDATKHEAVPFNGIFAVGDNPAADVR